MASELSREKRVAIALFLVLGTALGGVFTRAALQEDTYLLRESGGADWIRHDHPFSLLSWGEEPRTVYFRAPMAEASTEAVMLHVCALRRAAVFWNGALLLDTGADLEQWQQEHEVHLPAGEAGRLEIAAMNHNGPVLIRVRGNVGAFTTPWEWESSLDQLTWQTAITAAHRAPLPIQQAYPHPLTAVLWRLPWMLAIGLAVGGAVYWMRGTRPLPHTVLDAANEDADPASGWRKRILSPGGLRWALLGFWLLLGANNLQKIPPEVGMDALAHLEYIAYVWMHWRIPLATDGWQMFQSPLYYLLSAPLYGLAAAFLETDRVMQVLRIVPLLCGALQTEVAYRTARLALPRNGVGQGLATLFGALIPMQVYIAQVAGNEPLCSLLGSIVVYQVLQLLAGEKSELTYRRAAGIGACLGLALLTKASALLLAPVVLTGLCWRCYFSPAPEWGGAWRKAGLLFGLAGLIAAPYYLRNWLHLGKPFSGGWDPARAIVWWQDPGYRTAADFLRFGEGITQPIYAATHGLWDSLYSTLWLDGSLSGMAAYEHRPPWNDGWLVAGAVLGLIPMAVLSVGFIAGLASRDRARFRLWGLSAASLAIFLGALAHHFLTVPFFSSGKATYLGSIAPALVILFAFGLNAFQGRRSTEAITTGLVAVWALGVVCTYWVL